MRWQCYKFSPLRLRWKHAFVYGLILFLVYYMGLFTHIHELDYYSDFKYPYDVDLPHLIEKLKNNQRVEPLNEYNYELIFNCEDKCASVDGFADVRLVFLVRSPPENFDQRMSIRNSWGYEYRFSDVPVRTVFILGLPLDDSELQQKIKKESLVHKDIVQGSFIDNFYNSTIKTVAALKWAKDFCPKSKFYMMTTDSIYVSTKNVLYFLRNPANYPDYIHDRFVAIQRLARQKREISISQINAKSSLNNVLNVTLPNNSTEKYSMHRFKRQIEYELADDVLLYAGYVYVSAPHRHRTSKWYVSLDEYPFHMYPRYVLRDAFVLSREALLTLYYGSLYTKHFKFDDVYLGLVAKKTGLVPFHCEEIHFQRKPYSNYNYKYVVASSGYGNSDEMVRLWSEQKEMGHA